MAMRLEHYFDGEMTFELWKETLENVRFELLVRPPQNASLLDRPTIPKIGFMGLRQVLQSVKGSGPLLPPSLSAAIQGWTTHFHNALWLWIPKVWQKAEHITGSSSKPRQKFWRALCELAAFFLRCAKWGESERGESKKGTRSSSALFVFCQLQLLWSTAFLMHRMPRLSIQTQVVPFCEGHFLFMFDCCCGCLLRAEWGQVGEITLQELERALMRWTFLSSSLYRKVCPPANT